MGGHCIGVDPYYLAYKSESLGYQPEVILSGRRVNDNMGKFVAEKVIKMMIAKRGITEKSKVLILGFAFKENCPDTRNTKVIDIYRELKAFNIKVDVYDPWADPIRVSKEYQLQLIKELDKEYEAIILAVSHRQFLSIDYQYYKNMGTIIYDTKSFIDKKLVDARL